MNSLSMLQWRGRRRKGNLAIVKMKRARVYDLLALLTVIVVIALDQWTKNLVVQYLSPPFSGRPPVPIIGQYLTLYYVQNAGAAFSMFENSAVLFWLIAAAVIVIAYLYIRILNSGPLKYKIIFGMIIGGAAGNLLDRAFRGGSVVDFIWFRIPEIHYSFAVFNLADASISIGVFLLFVFILFGGLRKTEETTDKEQAPASKEGEQRV